MPLTALNLVRASETFSNLKEGKGINNPFDVPSLQALAKEISPPSPVFHAPLSTPPPPLPPLPFFLLPSIVPPPAAAAAPVSQKVPPTPSPSWGTPTCGNSLLSVILSFTDGEGTG